jgi:hypothetical protein
MSLDFFNSRTNSEFKMSDKLRSYAVNDYWMAKTGLWKLAGGVYDKAGSIVYERITDMVKNIGDVDLCDIKQLQSLCYQLGIKSGFGYIDSLPTEIYDLLNVLSIKQNFFFESGKCFTKEGLVGIINKLEDVTGISAEKLYDIAERYEFDDELFINASNVLIECQTFEIDGEKSHHTIEWEAGERLTYKRINNSTKFKFVFQSEGGRSGYWTVAEFVEFSRSAVADVSESMTLTLNGTATSTHGICLNCVNPLTVKLPVSRSNGALLQTGDFVEVEVDFIVDPTSIFISSAQFIEDVIFQSYYDLIYEKLTCDINAGNDLNGDYLKEKFLKIEPSTAFQQNINDGNVNFEYYQALAYSNFCSNVTGLEELSYDWFLNSDLPNIEEIGIAIDNRIEAAPIIADVARTLTDITITASIRREVLKSVSAQYSKIGTNSGIEKLVKNYVLRNYTAKKTDWNLSSNIARSNDLYLPTLSSIGGSFDVDVVEYWDETPYLNISAKSAMIKTPMIGVEQYKKFEINLSGQLVSSWDSKQFTYYVDSEVPQITGGNSRFWSDPTYYEQMLIDKDKIVEFYSNVEGSNLSNVEDINTLLSAIWEVHSPSSWDSVNPDIQKKYYGGEGGLYRALNVGNTEFATVAPAVNLLGLSETFGSLERDYQSVINDDRPNIVESGSEVVPGGDVYLPFYPGVDSDRKEVNGLPPDIDPESASNFVYNYREYFLNPTTVTSIEWHDEVATVSGVSDIVIWTPSTILIPSTENRISSFPVTLTAEIYRTQLYLDAITKTIPINSLPFYTGYSEEDPPGTVIEYDYTLYGNFDADGMQITNANFDHNVQKEKIVYDDMTLVNGIYNSSFAFIPELTGLGSAGLAAWAAPFINEFNSEAYINYRVNDKMFSGFSDEYNIVGTELYTYQLTDIAYYTEVGGVETPVTFGQAITEIESLEIGGVNVIQLADYVLNSNFLMDGVATDFTDVFDVPFASFSNMWTAIKDGKIASSYLGNGYDTAPENIGNIFVYFLGIRSFAESVNGYYLLLKAKEKLAELAASIESSGTAQDDTDFRNLVLVNHSGVETIASGIESEYNSNAQAEMIENVQLSALPLSAVEKIFNPTSGYSLDQAQSVINLGSASIFDYISSNTIISSVDYVADINVPSAFQASSIVKENWTNTYIKPVSARISGIEYHPSYRDISVTSYKVNTIPGSEVDQRLEFDMFDVYGGLVNSWRNVNVELRGYHSCYEASPNLDKEYDVNKFIDIDGPWIGEALYSLLEMVCTSDIDAEPQPERLNANVLLSEFANDGSALYANSDKWYLTQYTSQLSIDTASQLTYYINDILDLRTKSIVEFEVDSFGNNYTLFKNKSADQYDETGTVWMRFAQFPFSFPLMLPESYEGSQQAYLDQINVGITVQNHRHLVHNCLSFGVNNNVIWMAGYDAPGHFNIRIYANSYFTDSLGRNFYGIRNPRKLFAFNDDVGESYHWKDFVGGFFDQSSITFMFCNERGIVARSYNLVTERIDSKESYLKFPVSNFLSIYEPKRNGEKNLFRMVEDDNYIYVAWLTIDGKLVVVQANKEQMSFKSHLVWNVPASELDSELDKFVAGTEMVKVKFKSGNIYYARLSGANFSSNSGFEEMLSGDSVKLKYIANDLASLEADGNQITIPKVPIIDITQWRHWCYNLTTNTLYTMQYEPALLVSAIHEHIENKNYTHSDIVREQLFVPGNYAPQDIVSYLIDSGAYVDNNGAQVLTGWDINFSWNSLTDRLQQKISAFAPHYAVSGVEPSQDMAYISQLNESASSVNLSQYVGLPYNAIYSERTDTADGRKALSKNAPENFYNYLVLKNFYNYSYEHEYNWTEALREGSTSLHVTGWRKYLKCGISKYSDAMWMTYNYLRDPYDYSNIGKQRSVAKLLNDYEWVELVYGTIQLMNNSYSKSNVFSIKLNDSKFNSVDRGDKTNEEVQQEIAAKAELRTQIKSEIREFIAKHAPARTQLWQIDFND